MNTQISNKLVSGVGAMKMKLMVPFSVRMRQNGMVRVPNTKAFTSWWVPIRVVNEAKSQKVRQAKRREHLAVYGDIEPRVKAVCSTPQAVANRSREWGDIMYARDKVLLRELPAGRLTPPQFRAWVHEGFMACRDRFDERLYWRHIEKIRLDYFAELPECVFAPAVQRERDARVLREYRASHAERKIERATREEIRHLQVLLMDYMESPSRFFDTDAEMNAELDEVTAELGAKLDALQLKETKAMVTTWSDVVRK